MTMVVGFAPDGRGKAVLQLGAMLARSADDDLVVCAVVPQLWPPSPARVDAEYRAEMKRTAQDALDRARARLPADIPATFVIHDARSAPAGLLQVARQRDATLLIAGSSPHGGPGYVSVGSTTSRLLHSSSFPVALASGFRARADARVTRVTAAYGGGADDLVVAAAGVAARVGASLRIASFAVQQHAP